MATDPHNHPLRIIFMGTPEFAVPSLEALIASRHEVVAVVTATDKQGGRGGKKWIESAVKKCAQKHGIDILQPPRLKNREWLEELRSYRADLQLVVAFRMLPEQVWNMPPLGTYNLHGSLLPAYRGAAPIHWAVIRGETQTGVSTFKLAHAIDTGNIALQESIPIGPDDTTGVIYEQLMHLGARLLVETTEQIAAGTLELYAQDESQVSHAPKILSPDAEINTHLPGAQVHNLIRGMNPFPGAWIMIDDLRIKIFKTRRLGTASLRPGQWLSDNKSYLYLGCLEEDLEIIEWQLPGKRRMEVLESLRGVDISSWPQVRIEIPPS